MILKNIISKILYPFSEQTVFRYEQRTVCGYLSEQDTVDFKGGDNNMSL